jgi:hypothetical protein
MGVNGEGRSKADAGTVQAPWNSFLFWEGAARAVVARRSERKRATMTSYTMDQRKGSK